MALVLTGCAASGPAPTPSPTAAVSSPSDAKSLRDLGLAHGPTTFFLPRTLTSSVVVDQPNVVMLSIPVEQGPAVADWLVGRLGAGWSVGAHKDTSVLWTTREGTPVPWEGAFTCSPTVCQLTLRQQ